MRTSILILVVAANITGAVSQTVIFSEPFDTDPLAPGWTWLGSAPMLGGGMGGPYCLMKESWDQSFPIPPNGAPPMAFHAIPYDPTWHYQVNATMILTGPGATSAMAYCGLGWVDMSTGAYSVSGVDATSFSTMYWQLTSSISSTASGNSVGPNAQFGIMLMTDPSCVNAYANFDDIAVTVTTPGAVVLRPRLWLDGPYDQGLGLMRDDLRLAGLVPLNEPNTAFFGAPGGETTTPAVLDIVGNNAIVDWVRIELRSSPNGPALARRNALLQRDGDVVATDGASPITFALAAGNYHVVVRHRNHLAVMTASSISLGTTATVLDLRSPFTALYVRPFPNTDLPVKSIGAQRLLWAGNVQTDDRLKYTGTNNDRDAILATIGGAAPTHTITGYLRADVTMDGVVSYTGAGNDRDRILVNIGGAVPTAVRIQQVP
jgi:hypothetical protein